MDPIQTYKQAFHRGDDLIHLNNAGVAPWPIQTEAVVKEWASRIASHGTHAAAAAAERAEEARQALAFTLGATTDQIAFFQTCAQAISQVAFGLHFMPGDEIVTLDQEYPSNFYPWRLAAERAQAKLVVAESSANLATPLEAIKAKVTHRTKVIAVSWVQYRNGAIMDLEPLAAFARDNDIITCVDIIQGAGLLPFDFTLSGIDFACGGSHKWLTSPLALGFLLMKPKFIEQLNPLAVGAMSFGGFDMLSDIKMPMSKGVARFEPGGKGLLEMIGLNETLKLVRATKIENITKETERLANKLASGLIERGYVVNSPHEFAQRGSIVNFSPTEKTFTTEKIDQRFLANKISYTKRQPGIRLSPHAFMTDQQIEKVLEVLV